MTFQDDVCVYVCMYGMYEQWTSRVHTFDHQVVGVVSSRACPSPSPWGARVVVAQVHWLSALRNRYGYCEQTGDWTLNGHPKQSCNCPMVNSVCIWDYRTHWERLLLSQTALFQHYFSIISAVRVPWSQRTFRRFCCLDVTFIWRMNDEITE